MLSLQLFGGASLQTDAGPVTGPAVQRRRLALLALLAASPTRAVSRDRLAAYFWPDEERERARHLLADSLSTLRKALGKEVVLSVGDDLVLNPAAVRCDVCDFLEALDRADPETAVALYRGAFLDGFFVTDAPGFDEWQEAERQRLGRLYGAALESLATAAEEQGDDERATNWWMRLAAHDPFSSRVALRLMRALAAAGERARAIQHARVHAARLREELDASPDPEVEALAARLAAHAEPPGSTTARPRVRPAEEGPVAVNDGPEPGADPAAAPGRRLAAVWFADIVSYTRLTSEDEPAAFRLVQRFQRLSRETSAQFGGRLVKFIGDAALAEFGSTEAAVRAALTLEHAFSSEPQPSGAPAQLRIGVHVGDVMTGPDGDLYGDGVNVAARIQTEAEPGQVLVSEDVWRQLRPNPVYHFASLGERELRGITARIGVFGVALDDGRGRPGETTAALPGPAGIPSRPLEEAGV